MEENKLLPSKEYSAVCKEFRSRFNEANLLFEIIAIVRVDWPGLIGQNSTPCGGKYTFPTSFFSFCSAE
tara:strand:+ start:2037 stop:2243 length:207 start_codon:yes stop_codon:yes gene_type:complete